MPYYDVSGDGFCTPNDVLRVINFLNIPKGEAELDEAFASFAGSPMSELSQGVTRPDVHSTRRSTNSALSLQGATNNFRYVATAARTERRQPPRRTETTHDLASEVDAILDEIAEDVTTAPRDYQ